MDYCSFCDNFCKYANINKNKLNYCDSCKDKHKCDLCGIYNSTIKCNHNSSDDFFICENCKCNGCDHCEFKTLTDKILYNIQKSELGDILTNRFDIVVATISNTAIIRGNKKYIEKYYENYRCWNQFNFNNFYTWYEYSKWIGSVDDFAYYIYKKYNNDDKSDFELLIHLKLTKQVCIDVMKNILDDLIYTINNDVMIIKLIDLSLWLDK